MKKITIFFAIALISFAASSQTFVSESFDGTTFPPVGWTNIEVPVPLGFDWTRVTTGTEPTCNTHSGAGMAMYSYDNYDHSAILATPEIDLSGIGSNTARISFWMYRDIGYPLYVDSVDIYVGTSLTSSTHLGRINRNINLAPIETTDGWYKYYFDIPSSYNSSTNYVIFKASSHYGNNIFIDDISVYMTSNDDAGITEINAPNSGIGIGSWAVTSTIKNFGTSTLTNATIGWALNGVNQTPQPWNGSLAPFATSDSVLIGTYNFTSTGFYTIKSWAENPNGNPDGDNTNDTATKVIYVQDYAPLPFTENFDSAWINKFDTSDVPSLFWTNTPFFSSVPNKTSICVVLSFRTRMARDGRSKP